MLELLHKIKRLDVQLKVKAACQKELQFPVLKKQIKASTKHIDVMLPSITDVLNEVSKAKSEAMDVLESLGMKIPNLNLDNVDSIKVTDETSIFVDDDSDDEADDVTADVSIPSDENEDIDGLDEDLLMLQNEPDATSSVERSTKKP